jgi:hypothetical protein
MYFLPGRYLRILVLELAVFYELPQKRRRVLSPVNYRNCSFVYDGKNLIASNPKKKSSRLYLERSIFPEIRVLLKPA